MRIVVGHALEELEINAVNKNKSAQTGVVKTADALVHAQTLLESQTQAVRLSWHRPYSTDIDDLHHVDDYCVVKWLELYQPFACDVDRHVMTLRVHCVCCFYADLLHALGVNADDLNGLKYLNWQNDHATVAHE